MSKFPYKGFVAVVVNPILSDLAKDIADGIPENSILRSDLSRRIISFLSGLLRDYKPEGDDGVFFEKASCFFMHLSSELGKKPEKTAMTFHFERLSMQELEDLWGKAQEKLAEAPPERKKEVQDEIILELQKRQEILQEFIKAAKNLEGHERKD